MKQNVVLLKYDGTIEHTVMDLQSVDDVPEPEPEPTLYNRVTAIEDAIERGLNL